MKQSGLVLCIGKTVSGLLADVGDQGHNAGSLDRQAGGTLEGGTIATSLA